MVGEALMREWLASGDPRKFEDALKVMCMRIKHNRGCGCVCGRERCRTCESSGRSHSHLSLYLDSSISRPIPPQNPLETHTQHLRLSGLAARQPEVLVGWMRRCREQGLDLEVSS